MFLLSNSFYAENATRYELSITNIKTGELIQYTMLDYSEFTQPLFWSAGLHQVCVNAYGTNMQSFEPIYFEVHNGERPNTYIGEVGKKCYEPQNLTITHDALMQEQLIESVVFIYKDGIKYYEGSTVSSGLYTRFYNQPGKYEANILLTYGSGYGIYTKTITWNIGHVPGTEATCTTAQTCVECGTILDEAKGHNYVSGNYIDPTHPHKIYKLCACGDRQDSGLTEINKNCMFCNLHTETEIIDNTTFKTTVLGLDSGCSVIMALYNGNVLVDLHIAEYAGIPVVFKSDVDYEYGKVMVWDSKTMLELCHSELIR